MSVGKQKRIKAAISRMNGTDHSSFGSRDPRPAASPRKSVVICVILLVVVLIGGLVAIKSRTRSTNAIQQQSDSQNAPPPQREKQTVPHKPLASQQLPSSKRVPMTAAAPATPRPPSEVMAELIELSESRGPITKEQAEKFRQNLDELIRQGAASVPAIREFLKKNVDTDFNDIPGADQLSYSSFRAALFDTLKQITGVESQTAMVEALETTALPAELLELAKDLDQSAPGVYRAQILKAAHQALDMAAAHQLGSDVELGPAYRILQNYGDANTSAELARNDPATFQNALQMANLPDGQGLPGLIQMASQDPGPSRDPSQQIIATEMIAQLAGQNAQALETLTQMAQKGQIRNNVWEKIAPILGGEQFQFDSSASSPNSPAQPTSSDYTTYSVVNVATTPEQINQRIALVEKFLALVPPDSAAAASLQNQRGILNGRLAVR